jgi:hypothetical protein
MTTAQWRTSKTGLISLLTLDSFPLPLTRQPEGFIPFIINLASLIMYIDVLRTSSAISALSVNPIAKRALVTFKNGSIYEYKNVSTIACTNVILNSSISLGKWVNENCIHSDRAILTWSYKNGNQYGYNEPQLPAIV